MNLEKLVAVSGMSGLFKLAANRSNGLVLEDISSGKMKFFNARQHKFTPLESIGIYTDDGETAALKEVFEAMQAQAAENPPVDADADPTALFEYFAKVLPSFDRDRVHASDIRKVLKWFAFMQTHNLLQSEPVEEAQTAGTGQGVEFVGQIQAAEAEQEADSAV